eukprot:1098183-Rhodomonas_salina.2
MPVCCKLVPCTVIVVPPFDSPKLGMSCEIPKYMIWLEEERRKETPSTVALRGTERLAFWRLAWRVVYAGIAQSTAYLVSLVSGTCDVNTWPEISSSCDGPSVHATERA